MSNQRPSLQIWLDEIKADSTGPSIGIFFIHNAVVRGSTRDGCRMAGLDGSCEREGLARAVADAESMPGVVAARAWVNEGELKVGDDMIYALVAGDVRKNVFGCWQTLVRRIKAEVITAREILWLDPAPQ